MNGTILGTRILTHSHGTVEFTRSDGISIPQSTDEMVIRGHDQNYGFGGQVALVKISTNEIYFIDQGEEVMDFSEYIFDELSSDNENNVDEAYFPTLGILFIGIIFGLNQRKR